MNNSNLDALRKARIASWRLFWGWALSDIHLTKN